MMRKIFSVHVNEIHCPCWGGIKMVKVIRKILTAALIIAVFAQGACAAVEEPQVLKDLIAQAEKNNPLISAQHQKVIRYDRAIDEAKGKMGPQAMAAYGALFQKDALIPDITLPLLGTLKFSPLDSKELYGAAVGLMQTIYSGGSLQAMRSAATLARDATLAEEIRVRQNVDNAVRVAYYNEKRAEAKKIVAEEAVKLTNDHLGRAQKLFNGGVIPRADVLRAKVAVADANLNLIRAGNAVELMITALERAVGSPIDTASLRGNAVTRVEKKAIHTAVKNPVSSDDITYAWNNRAELKMYSLLSKQAGQIARAAKGQLLPQVAAGGLLSNVDDKVIPGGNTEWQLGVMGYWKFLDSGQMKAKAAQAQAQAKELLYRLDDMKNAIKMDVTQAELNLRSAQTRLEVATRQVTESEEDYRIAVKRYEGNVGTNLDMMDARLALIASRTNLVDAIYDIEISKANLIFAMGE
jgi:outer membrane protein